MDSSLVHTPIHSDWIAHMSFAKWLTKTKKPEKILDLGTYKGCSALAFGAHKIGDVYTVDKEIDDRTKEILTDAGIEYRVSLFKDVVDLVEDGSLDILHIDGSHILEDVTEDVINFVPKLKKDGILLMHDTWNPAFYGPLSLFIKGVTGNKLMFLKGYGLGIATTDNDMYNEIYKTFHKELVTGDMLSDLLLYVERKNTWLKMLSESSVREQAVKDLNTKTDLLSTVSLLPLEQSSS